MDGTTTLTVGCQQEVQYHFTYLSPSCLKKPVTSQCNSSWSRKENSNATNAKDHGTYKDRYSPCGTGMLTLKFRQAVYSRNVLVCMVHLLSNVFRYIYLVLIFSSVTNAYHEVLSLFLICSLNLQKIKKNIVIKSVVI